MKPSTLAVYKKRARDAELKNIYDNLSEIEKMMERNLELVRYIEFISIKKKLENDYYKKKITKKEKQEILEKCKVKQVNPYPMNEELEFYNFDIFNININ
jgi:hypothetical protein